MGDGHRYCRCCQWRAATADTLFRIGSTSKASRRCRFCSWPTRASLSLDDPVHKLAPEVWFENRWEATDPVRVVEPARAHHGLGRSAPARVCERRARRWACAKGLTTTTTRVPRAGRPVPGWPTATPDRQLPPTSSKRSPASGSKTSSAEFLPADRDEDRDLFRAGSRHGHDALSR